MLKNGVARVVYKVKFYIDVMDGQVGWITGKITQLMGVLYIMEYLGHPIPRGSLLWLAPLAIVVVLAAGFLWKRIGLYDLDQYTSAMRNPVQHELLNAARIIEKAKKQGKL